MVQVEQKCCALLIPAARRRADGAVTSVAGSSLKLQAYRLSAHDREFSTAHSALARWSDWSHNRCAV
eukprot:8416-Heterococcus_DN1.PRE.1